MCCFFIMIAIYYYIYIITYYITYFMYILWHFQIKRHIIYIYIYIIYMYIYICIYRHIYIYIWYITAGTSLRIYHISLVFLWKNNISPSREFPSISWQNLLNIFSEDKLCDFSFIGCVYICVCMNYVCISNFLCEYLCVCVYLHLSGYIPFTFNLIKKLH